MAFLSRSLRRRIFRFRILIILAVVICFLDANSIINSLQIRDRVFPSSLALPPQKIFIASMFRNSEYILRASFINTLMALIVYLGPSNVYVSISESGSLDNTKGALMDLKAELEKLGVRNRIVTGIDHTQQLKMLTDLPPKDQRQGWIYTGRPESKSGKEGWEKRRIPYLAKERNMVMEPLVANLEREWDKVLWLNDIVFSNEDVVTLLETRAGKYDAACALDFSSSSQLYYDTFALRDSLGTKPAALTWPIFLSRDSLSAMRANRPVPVKSCWNGMIAMDAKPFYPVSVGGKGLQFRGVDDSLAQFHVEGSECCLIHADNRVNGEGQGVWLNPNVRITYNLTTYSVVNPAKIVESGVQWPTKLEMVKGVWKVRLVRWIGWVKLFSEEAMIRGRVEKWIADGKKEKGEIEKRQESGIECLVNEMQVLYDNGWNHV